jgi:AraC-like DNA-binding protein
MSYWAMQRRRSDIAEWYIHHGPPDALDNLPLYILRATKDARGPSRPVRRRLQFYSLAWLKEGGCWYWSEGQHRAVRVRVGEVIAVGPRLLHAYGGHGRSFREDFVAFFGPVADGFRAMGLFDPARPLISLRDPERIGEIAEIVRDVFSLEAQLRAGLLLQRILIDARFDAAHEASPHYPAIQRLLKRIAAEPDTHLRNKQMAESCGMSESHFRKLFREEVGMAPNHYCERLRMDRACELLAETTLRVHEIASELGYDDPLYFSKRFAAVIGVSPRAYRRSTHQ